jgi:dTDP-4-dehydrorhamnose reductase
LVTGVTGQVGSELLRCLDGYGLMIPVDRRAFDLSTPEGLPARLDEIRPDLIINPAAYTAVDRAESERGLAFAINARGPEAVARWAAQHGIPLLHFSTDYVFYGSGNRPWHEDDVIRPLNIYGESKAAGERAIKQAGGPHLIVRTSWVYSAARAGFFRTIAKAATEREELKVVVDQIGAPTSAAWLAETISNIVKKNSNDLSDAFARAGRCVHIAASGETSWHGFALAIVSGLKARDAPIKAQDVIPVATKDFSMRASRPLNSRLDLSRLAQIFNITPPRWSELLPPQLDQLVARS